LRGVLKQKAVTSETISMSISVYLLLGFTWSILYDVIFILQPGAFSIAGLAASIPGHPVDPKPLSPVLAYFSLISGCRRRAPAPAAPLPCTAPCTKLSCQGKRLTIPLSWLLTSPDPDLTKWLGQAACH
jgi:hypothetical protein